jgi:uncharacterized protein YecT (DUF1311 family)
VAGGLAIVAVALGCGGLFAQPTAGALTRSQDSALHAAYKRLLTRLGPYQREQLAQSQRAWVRFRDAQCNFEGSVLIGGPLGIEQRAQAGARAECLGRETGLRTRALRADYKMSWGGTD